MTEGGTHLTQAIEAAALWLGEHQSLLYDGEHAQPDLMREYLLSKKAAVTVKTIGQVVTKYDDQLANAVHDVWNGHSSAIDLRRAHKAMLKDFAPQVYEEGMREGGTDELDDEDRSDMDEAIGDWLGGQFEHINQFAADVVAVKDADDVKAARAAILDRVTLWVDSLRELGDLGRAYALKNVKAFWKLGDRQTHTQDCIDLSKLKAHRVSWWTDKGYIPGSDRHIGCGCSLRNAKTDEVIMGE